MESKPQNGGGQDQTPMAAQESRQGLPESQEPDAGRGAPQSPAENRTSTPARRRGAERSSSLWNASPLDTMTRLSREMDQLMESFFGGRFAFPGRFRESRRPGDDLSSLWSPRIDVEQKKDAVTISAELPGISKDAIQIEATEDGIAISGEREQTREQGGGDRGYQLSERSYGSFYRNIPLPEGANVEEARATMRDGVLEITVPLKAGQKRRQIEISGRLRRSEAARAVRGLAIGAGPQMSPTKGLWIRARVFRSFAP